MGKTFRHYEKNRTMSCSKSTIGKRQSQFKKKRYIITLEDQSQLYFIDSEWKDFTADLTEVL